ncbi:MAG: hypothetical protein KAV87_63405, partial [Desulfobacteraceae bacterium]|nr:hypothetical protein [Desulfobacteraceae bacterium]
MRNSRESYHRVKVLKLIWSIPHYRVPIFRRLSQHPYLDFTVCAGDSSKVFDGAQLATGREVGDMSGVNWRLVKSSRIRFPLFNNYEWQGEAIKIVWKENPDVVICFGIKSLSNWLVRAICRLRGIPVIEWGQGIRTAERGLKWAVRKFYNKWAKAHLLYAKFA